jgi:hypothetical protein
LRELQSYKRADTTAALQLKEKHASYNAEIIDSPSKNIPIEKKFSINCDL